MTMMGRQRGVFIGFLHRQQQDNHRSLGLIQVEGGQEWCLPPQEMEAKSWGGSVFFWFSF